MSDEHIANPEAEEAVAAPEVAAEDPQTAAEAAIENPELLSGSAEAEEAKEPETE